MKFLIVGTAGHIDHGKSSLIRSLTGTDPDRLKEEKERGITIDLGFAHMRLGDTQIGFVDVPGHERFVRNMLAGAGGMDAVLFVVAADESVMPQTREHLDICNLLGIERGIFVVTKIDLVEREMLPLVAEEVQSAALGTALESFPVVFVSNTSGEGLNGLKQRLEELARESTPRATGKLARLPIDRVFTIHGFGTVVTGTLYSGQLRRDQTVEILPGPILTKIRGLQSYGSKVELAAEGQRTALNLQGVDKSLLSRGMTLTLPGAMRPTQCLDASLFLVQQAETSLKKRDVVRLHLGTQETLARVLLLQTDLLRQGQSGLAQFRTQRPVCAWMGDRFIVRRVSPASTIGGGEILDPAARKRKKKTQEGGLAQVLLNLKDTDRVGAWVRAHGYASEQTLVSVSGYPADHLLECLPAQPDLVLLGASPRFYCSQDFLQGLSRRLLQMVESFHNTNPLAPGMRKEEVRTKLPSALPVDIFQHLLDKLREQEKLEIRGEFVSIAGKTALLSPEDQRLFDRLEQLLKESGSQPPSIKELLQKIGIDDKRGRNLVFLLQQRNVVVKIGEDLLVHRAHLDQVRQRLKENFPPGSQFSVGQFKDLLGITRKHAIPLLEYLDRQRVTRRVGDFREVLK